eukprot:TRINITY_DN97962_c0_g1_i1.p1 TRINITY_DN97962_c0_g1~~TRINITY_DN97962_c0_g1_i1.p1  ORF type:complete len:300 (+),score=43.51 TRINITY_DN97962_c0_g1_i1:76-975(+)
MRNCLDSNGAASSSRVQATRSRSRSALRSEQKRTSSDRVILVDVEVVNSLSADHVCMFSADSTWTVRELKHEILRLAGHPEHQQKLLIGDRILSDGEVVKELCCESGIDSTLSQPLKIGVVISQNGFYVRYMAQMGDEFHEFEFRSDDGRFRYARKYSHQSFFKGKQIRKECFLSQETMALLKGMVKESGILQLSETDTAQMRAPDGRTRQELEIMCDGHQVDLVSALPQTFSHINPGRRLSTDEFSLLDWLAEEVRILGNSLIEVHFKDKVANGMEAVGVPAGIRRHPPGLLLFGNGR